MIYGSQLLHMEVHTNKQWAEKLVINVYTVNFFLVIFQRCHFARFMLVNELKETKQFLIVIYAVCVCVCHPQSLTTLAGLNKAII
jgi:hypothetical protein